MQILTPQTWKDYELLDTGNGRRLERFGEYILSRPDPQLVWKPHLSDAHWAKADAIFQKTGPEKGHWTKINRVPDKWKMSHGGLTFEVRLTPFKHTGIFPEQAAHWEFMRPLIEKSKKEVSVLNLFGYTGLATLVAAKAGAKVTHVDASYPTIGWARENQKLSGLDKASIRWIEDDVLKFVRREVKRGAKYDGILMDPPAYGRGPKGETWIFNESFPQLMEECRQLLSPNPLFVIVNAYAISSSALMLKNVLGDFLGNLGGTLDCGELALKEKSAGRLLSTGIYARWSK